LDRVLVEVPTKEKDRKLDLIKSLFNHGFRSNSEDAAFWDLRLFTTRPYSCGLAKGESKGQDEKVW
jgi:hypothetical protein